jgi:hypothetical protein
VDQARLALRTWLITGDLPEPADAERRRTLLSAAAEQGLTALLADAIAMRDDWPTGAREPLRQAARLGLVRTVRQLDLAGRVHLLLLRHDLRSLPLKGAAVAEWLYDSPAHRAMGDVDLLALDAPEDALRLLQNEGFERVGTAEHAFTLRERGTGEILELHRSITTCPALFPLDLEALWQRRTARPAQLPCVPCAADLLVLLALHAAFQHGLVLTLSQWMDFRRLAERLAPSLSTLERLAPRPVARAVALALLASKSAVAAPFGPELLAWARDALPRRLLALASPSSDSPLRLLTPARAPLARLRWAIASGHRGRLLRATLFPDVPEEGPGAHRALGVALKRCLRLVRQIGRG